MKKIITFLLSAMLFINYATLSAQYFSNAHFESELCNFRFVLLDRQGFGWFPESGIEITVDGVNYGLINLPWGTPYGEEIRALPSGEVIFTWIGSYNYMKNYFEIYNSLDELIYSSPEDDFLYENPFFTYQNECIACIPLSDFEGEYDSETKQVNLTWIAPESDDLTGFEIYRNEELLAQVPPSTISYSDNTAELADGDYKYCVVPVYPSVCNLDEKCFEAYITNVGIVNYIDNILIYPNPANDIVTISGIRVSNVKVFNNVGQLVLYQHNTNTVNVTELQNGIYLLSIEVSTGHIIHKKIIINH
ncbi:MAG: T9SS type A sorting domain-containing protein [Bacteroidales bacterium]|jgi:hypothetical protein|nr:T9SS type A sorting domain-containing protein [Bacteroidales bacterium]